MVSACILTRFVQGALGRNMPATTGAEFLAKVGHGRAGEVPLSRVDIRPRGLENWASEIADKAPHNVRLVAIGNKIDLVDDRVVPRAAREDLAKKLQAVFYGETSPESGDGINEIVTGIAELDPGHEDVQDSVREGALLQGTVYPGGRLEDMQG